MTNDVNDGNFAASVKSDEWDMLYNLINSRFVSFINTHQKETVWVETTASSGK
jgi:hypothetical protein